MRRIWYKLLSKIHPTQEMRHIYRARVLADWDRNNNRVYLVKQGKKYRFHGVLHGLKLKIAGANNVVEIDESCHFSQADIFVQGKDCRVILEENLYCSHFEAWVQGTGRLMHIKKGCHFVGNKFFVREKDLYIGEDCLFSDHIDIMTSDGHTLLDPQTRQQLNGKAGAVVIGNHVWVGRRVFLTKQAQIADHCIIGAASVVTKPFTKSYCALGGNPAKIVKEGIDWVFRPPLEPHESAPDCKIK